MHLCESLSCRPLLKSHQMDLLFTFVNKNWSSRLSCMKRHLPRYYAHHDSMTESIIFRWTYCGHALTMAWCLHTDTHGKQYSKQHNMVTITNSHALTSWVPAHGHSCCVHFTAISLTRKSTLSAICSMSILLRGVWDSRESHLGICR